MYIVKFTNQYKKSYKLMVKRGLNIKLLEDVIEILASGRKLDDKYKDHALVGEYFGFRECHIQADWLLVYFINEEVLTLTLVDTGTHSDLF